MSEQSTPARSAPRVVTARRRPHVVIVGGGIRRPDCRVRGLRKADVDITLVDRHTYNAFQPLLYQVATAGLNPGDVTFFLRAARMSQRNVSFRQGEVVGIDTDAQKVTFTDGGEMAYDYLVLGTGATTNYFGTKGAEENTMAIYTRAQALALRDRIFTNLEHAAASGDRARTWRWWWSAPGRPAWRWPARWPNSATTRWLSVYPELDPRRTHIVLVEMTDKVLAPVRREAAGVRREGAARAWRRAQAEHVGGGGRGRTAWCSATASSSRPASWSGRPASRSRRRWPTGACRRAAAAGSRSTNDLRVIGFKNIFAAGDVVDHPGSAAAAGARPPSSRACTSVSRSPRWSSAGRCTRSTTTTRARWPPSAAARLSPTSSWPRSRSIKLTGTLAWLVWMLLHIVTAAGQPQPVGHLRQPVHQVPGAVAADQPDRRRRAGVRTRGRGSGRRRRNSGGPGRDQGIPGRGQVRRLTAARPAHRGNSHSG